MKHAAANAVTETSTTTVIPAAESAEHVATGLDIHAILNDAETWIIVSFVIFAALFIRFLAPKLGKMLDGRADKIRDQLEQASRLRSEAEALLASYQLEQQKLLKEAESIIETAKRDAATLRASAAEELKLAVDRRTEQAKEKIARAEAEAVSAIRTRIIESATNSARDMLAQRAQAESDEQAVARAIAAIEQQVH